VALDSTHVSLRVSALSSFYSETLEKYRIVWEDRSTCEVQRFALGDELPI